MKEKFAVYGYKNIAYEEEAYRISGDMETLEEALAFRDLAEKTEVKNIFLLEELFVSTVIKSVGEKILLSIYSRDNKQSYIELLTKYEMSDLLE